MGLLLLFFRDLYRLENQITVWPERQLVIGLGTLLVILNFIVFIDGFYYIIIQCFMDCLLTVQMVYKANWEVVPLVEGGKTFVGPAHRLDATETALEAGEEVGLGEATSNLAIKLDLSFARLQNQRIFVKHRLTQENRILNLNERSKCRVVVLDEVLVVDFLDVRVDSRHGDVVGDPDVAGCVPPDLQVVLVVGVQDEKHFGFAEFFPLITGAQRLQDDEVVLGALYVDNVGDSVVDVDREWELLFAQLAVDLLELDDHVALDRLHSLVSFQPRPQTFQMDSAHSTRAIARRDHGVELLVGVIGYLVVVVQAYSTDHA